MKRISNKVKNSVLLVMVVVFIAIIIVSIYEINIDRSWRLAYKRECEMEKYCENMVAIFSAQYSRLIASGMGADEANAQAVADVFTSYRGGKEIYSIFATSDSILFYMNGDKKNDLSGYSFEEWIEQCIYKGGDNLDEIADYARDNESGPIRIAYDKSCDYYLAYYSNFTIGETTYHLIYNVRESYYLLNAQINRNYIIMSVMLGIIAALLLLTIVAVAYLIRRYNRLFRIKEEELFKCQNNMNLLYESMRDREENAKHGNIKDETLEVYSKSFIWTLMRDLQEKELDVAIAIIGASYCVENNRSNWKEYLYYIKTNIPDDYIFGVFDDGHMVLFGVDVDFQGFSIKVTTILNRANNMFQEYAWKSSYVFGERKQDGESLEEVIQEAIKEFDQMK